MKLVDEYEYRLSRNPSDGVWRVRITEFPDELFESETSQDALLLARRFVSDLLEKGGEHPIPFSRRSFSGKFTLRISKALHRKLAMEAERRRTSLNQLCVDLLS